MASKKKRIENEQTIELPKFPKYIWTPLGLLPVLDKRLDDALGDWDNSRRVIRLDVEISPVSGWQVIGHEQMHQILDDSGVSELLSRKQEEAVCRAYGSFIASWVLASGGFPFVTSDEYMDLADNKEN